MKKRLYNLPNKIIAVTGGIASGKTTYCKKLEEEGKTVIYADEIVKKIYKKKTFHDFLWSMYNNFFEFEDTFKYESKDEDELGEWKIDFKELRKAAFEFPMVLKSLEEFVGDHFEGEFLKEYMERDLNIPKQTIFAKAHGEISPVCGHWKDIYFEYAPEYLIDVSLFDDIIRCEAPKEERVERIIKRDGCSRETAEKMIETQERKNESK